MDNQPIKAFQFMPEFIKEPQRMTQMEILNNLPNGKQN
jgi:hypothetical protein